ncbi:Satratoxin biosynthesis SC1 cluster protein [Lachnellula subtilissima]|uniref:Satratoxin biosynthesis SC1 cluster protein n=1 Tax=Lachnellula subtilissima TaxID=602034 RepID=A0A8H8RKJ5_9HELO|nr:Satratoxin biosynthesis SC1 cluster protein [Lachnellula subtilissima]
MDAFSFCEGFLRIMEDDFHVAELSSYRARVVFVVTIIFLVTSTASIILRLMAKRVNKANLTADDYAILVAQVVNYGHSALVMLAQAYTQEALFSANIGHHADTIPSSGPPTFFKLLLPLQIIYGLILGLIKLSICLFYSRIFFTKRFRVASWTVISFIGAWTVGSVLAPMLICRPIAYNWDRKIKDGKCSNQTASFVTIGVFDLLIDIAVFALPLQMIWNLQVSTGKKAALFSIFGLGISTMILSILRIQALVTLDLSDVTYTATFPLLYAFLEPAIGITVACAPLFGPLIKISRFGKFFSQSGKTHEYNMSSNFERMTEHDYELNDFRPQVTTTITTEGKKPPPVPKRSTTFFDDGSESSILPGAGMEILVKSEWQMGRVEV